ncbi:MAG: C25 family cysteine peptidase [Candidatus Cloacimonadaceae bacterium]|nr:C25 family cysteine peptidase [Candidatus Cloacimonadota bacterium]
MKTTLLICVALLSVGLLIAGVSNTYYLEQPIITQNESEVIVKLANAQSWGEPGSPNLPWFGVKLLLPVGTEATAVSVKRSQPTTIKLDTKVSHLHRQYPLSWKDQIVPTEPNPDIYTINEAYPKSTDNGISTHFLSGHPIAFTAVSPFEYKPMSNELVFYQTITVDIDYSASSRAVSAQSLLKTDHFTQKRLQQSVDNSVPSYRELRDEGIDYLMIVDAEKLANWQPLADYYEGIGMSTQIVSVSDILNTTSGADDQEKIRNYIIAAYETDPLRYVLLGGDTDVIPHRGFMVDLGTGGESDNDIPADMYYSCLDGNWNDDNDNNWGEIYETDLVPELAIGRICYNSDLEIANQIYKITSYQMSPVNESIKSAFFVGEWLWDGPTWGGDYMDEMIGGSSTHGYTTAGVPSDWDISTLYDRTNGYEESWGSAQIRPLLSNGPNLVNHLGHSNTTYNMRLSNSQVSSSSITNDGASQNFSIYFTQGCYAGSFDNRNTYPGDYTSDSITEKFMSLPTSAAAMISHSRYGWGMQGSTDGASQYIHRQYIDAIFGENIHEVGYTLVDSKIDNIPFITNQPVMYWVDYETNLFGCPAMMIWTDTPQVMSVNLPSQWLVGLTQYTVQTDAPGAQLIIKKDSHTYFNGYADDNGIVTISLFASLDPGSYQVYINAPNYYSYNNTIFVTASEMPYIVCSEFAYDDDDAVIHTGEVLDISFMVKNVGMVDQAANGTILLSSSSPNIEVIDGTLDFTPLAAGDSLYYDSAFQIRIIGSYPDHSQANLQFNTSFDGYSTQSFSRITLAAPLLSMESYTITGPGSYIMPGDVAHVSFNVHNSGTGNAFSPMMMLFSNSPYLSTNVYDLTIAPVESGNTTSVPFAFEVQVSENAEIGTLHNIGYMLSAENGNVVEGVFSIHLGMLTYSFEPDLQNWTNAQLNNSFVDQWHRSSARNNTSGGSYSMKFGGSGSTQYAANAYGALISPEVAIAPNSRLKFYHWIDAEDHDSMPSYAWDGALLQMSLNGESWEQITPVGGYPYTSYNNPASPFVANTPIYSGQHDWTEAVFELGSASGTARFRFVFGSDGYVGGEGWYIDDVRIETEPVSNSDNTTVVQALVLSPNYPNPFNPETNISFNLPISSPARLEIFNLKGQRVRKLVDSELPAGTSIVTWNGKDDNGREVSSGVYFYRLSTDDKVISRKMMLMK